jgi:transcriptional regulator with XRE-family HTH domain
VGLFFDQDWFDDRLRASGLTRSSLAEAAGMTMEEVDQVFRDQRELDEREVMAFARVLSADPTEVATRSGAPDYSVYARSTPQRREGSVFDAPGPMTRTEILVSREALAGLHERMDRLERLIEMIAAKLDRAR